MQPKVNCCLKDCNAFKNKKDRQRDHQRCTAHAILSMLFQWGIPPVRCQVQSGPCPVPGSFFGGGGCFPFPVPGLVGGWGGVPLSSSSFVWAGFPCPAPSLGGGVGCPCPVPASFGRGSPVQLQVWWGDGVGVPLSSSSFVWAGFPCPAPSLVGGPVPGLVGWEGSPSPVPGPMVGCPLSSPKLHGMVPPPCVGGN